MGEESNRRRDERVKHTVKPEHYQIFYLHSVKDLPARQIAGLLHITTAKVYVVQHRVARLVRSQVEVLKRESEKRSEVQQVKSSRV